MNQKLEPRKGFNHLKEKNRDQNPETTPRWENLERWWPLNTLELTKKAIILWTRAHPGEILDQMCQRFTGYYTQWAYQGNESGITVYGSAKLAALDSVIVGHDLEDAEPGSFMYWELGKFWHVGLCLGRDTDGRVLVAYNTTKGDTVLNLGWGVKVSHAVTYPAKFYGWSWTNGKNPRMVGLTPYPEPIVFTPNQRRVLSTATANKRLAPNTTGEKVGAFPANSIVTLTGWQYGENVNGNAVWFTDGHVWVWSGGFTDTGQHDLADLNPKPEPTPEPEPEPTPEPEPPTTVDPPTQQPSKLPTILQILIPIGGIVLIGIASWVAGWWQ